MRRFRELVAEALDDLPTEFRHYMSNVEVTVEEVPPSELREKFKRGLLLGVYHGVPLPKRSLMATNMPDLISIYKRSIECICSTEEEIRQQVRATVMHEMGHHFGLSEDELRDV